MWYALDQSSPENMAGAGVGEVVAGVVVDVLGVDVGVDGGLSLSMVAAARSRRLSASGRMCCDPRL